MVDRAVEAHDGHIVVAQIDELCVKRLSVSNEGQIWLLSENETYPPIAIKEGMAFEVWGRIVCSILRH